MPRLALLAGASLLVACASTDKPDTASLDTASPVVAPVAASRSLTYASVAEIDARVDSIEKYLTAHRDELRLFARLSSDSTRLVAVKDSSSWPENSDASYNILSDSLGRMLFYSEMPVSESGDWFEVMTHYFAPDGRTILYDYKISGFSSGCTRILRERKRFYYDPGFLLLRQDSSYTDGEGKHIDAKDCERRSDEVTPARRRSADLPSLS